MNGLILVTQATFVPAATAVQSALNLVLMYGGQPYFKNYVLQSLPSYAVPLHWSLRSSFRSDPTNEVCNDELLHLRTLLILLMGLLTKTLIDERLLNVITDNEKRKYPPRDFYGLKKHLHFRYSPFSECLCNVMTPWNVSTGLTFFSDDCCGSNCLNMSELWPVQESKGEKITV